MLSAEYKALSPEEKAQWQKISAQDRARFNREMLSYVPPPAPPGVKKNTGLKNLEDDPDTRKFALDKLGAGAIGWYGCASHGHTYFKGPGGQSVRGTANAKKLAPKSTTTNSATSTKRKRSDPNITKRYMNAFMEHYNSVDKKKKTTVSGELKFFCETKAKGEITLGVLEKFIGSDPTNRKKAIILKEPKGNGGHAQKGEKVKKLTEMERKTFFDEKLAPLVNEHWNEDNDEFKRGVVAKAVREYFVVPQKVNSGGVLKDSQVYTQAFEMKDKLNKLGREQRMRNHAETENEGEDCVF